MLNHYTDPSTDFKTIQIATSGTGATDYDVNCAMAFDNGGNY